MFDKYHNNNKYLLLAKNGIFILVNKESESFNKICNYLYNKKFYKAFKYLSEKSVKSRMSANFYKKILSGKI